MAAFTDAQLSLARARSLAILAREIAYLQTRPSGGIARHGAKHTRQRYSELQNRLPWSESKLKRTVRDGRRVGVLCTHKLRGGGGVLYRVDLGKVVDLDLDTVAGTKARGPAWTWDTALLAAVNGKTTLAALIRKLHLLAESKSGQAHDGRLWATPTRRYLAAFLGVSLRTLDRALADGRQRGVIVSERRPNAASRLRVGLDALARLCETAGTTLPAWTQPKQAAMLPILAEADAAETLQASETVGAFEAALLEGMERNGWIHGADDAAVRPLRRELAEYSGATVPVAKAADILGKASARARVPVGFVLRLVRDDVVSGRFGQLDAASDGESFSDDVPGPDTTSSRTTFQEYDPLVVDVGASELWHRVLGRLESQIPRPSFETWLKDTVCVSFDGDGLLLGTRSTFVAEMLERQMYSLIGDAFEAETGDRPEIEIAVPSDNETRRPERGATHSR